MATLSRTRRHRRADLTTEERMVSCVWLPMGYPFPGGLPRLGGGSPKDMYASWGTWQLSPQKRGYTVGSVGLVHYAAVFPARAGVCRRKRRSCLLRRSFPRESGGT